MSDAAWDHAGPPLSEWEIHAEHVAALEATLFREAERGECEVVLELAGGALRRREGAREGE